MKIYRICKNIWTGKKEECAFVSSVESAYHYIKAQMPKNVEIAAHQHNPDRWFHNLENDNNQFMYAVENGCAIGEYINYYLLDYYWVDTIIVED